MATIGKFYELHAFVSLDTVRDLSTTHQALSLSANEANVLITFSASIADELARVKTLQAQLEERDQTIQDTARRNSDLVRELAIARFKTPSQDEQARIDKIARKFFTAIATDENSRQAFIKAIAQAIAEDEQLFKSSIDTIKTIRRLTELCLKDAANISRAAHQLHRDSQAAAAPDPCPFVTKSSTDLIDTSFADALAQEARRSTEPTHASDASIDAEVEF